MVLILYLLNASDNYYVNSFLGLNAKIPPYLFLEEQSFIIIELFWIILGLVTSIGY
jgi:hypothetical protein